MIETPRSWRVLLLSAGYGNEFLRDVAYHALQDLGFEIAVYDRPGYPIDSSVHSHAACIEAIDQCDIVVALADEKVGGTFQVAAVPEAMRQRLIGLGVLEDPQDVGRVPSILQVEILTARKIGKPVICLIPKSIRDLCHVVLEQLPNLVKTMSPRHSSVKNPEVWIENRDWAELDREYDVPVVGISFGQLVFLERIRRESPNYVSYYPIGSTEQFASHLMSRLAALPQILVRSNAERANGRLLRKRTPIAASDSLAWLRQQGLIISGPYTSDFPSDGDHDPLLRDGRSVALRRHLEAGTSVALLGDPGMGKSTYLLLAIVDLFEDLTDPPPNLLLAWWRDLPRSAQRSTAEELIRTLIGLAAGRAPWPTALPLPSIKWLIVIDGIDESDVDVASLRPLLRDLREYGPMLVSCREYDFERRLYPIQESFESFIRLIPWGRGEIDQYRRALAEEGDISAAEYIALHQDDYRGILSVPLWLTMTTFLSRRAGLALGAAGSSDYSLLTQCGQAVAQDELRRANVESATSADALVGAWRMAAWLIYTARRRGGPLREAALREALNVDGVIWSACVALLDERDGSISGFVHEIFLEYWLADYIVTAMMPQNSTLSRLTEALSLQRSVTTNRLVRQGIAHLDLTSAAAAGLREAFWQTNDDQVFTKNQILYLLGRIDVSPACVRFLVSVWQNVHEHPFVRYSAAYAAVMLGVHSVEHEFFSELQADNEFDRMNRWYHRYYYGDLYANEQEDPGLDDDASSADRAIEQLLQRLNRSRERNLRLRRIELFTLRRFVETRGIGELRPELLDRLAQIEGETSTLAARPEYAAGIREEIRLIRAAID